MMLYLSCRRYRQGQSLVSSLPWFPILVIWLMHSSLLVGVSSFTLTSSSSLNGRTNPLSSRCWAKGRRGNLGSIVDDISDDSDERENQQSNTFATTRRSKKTTKAAAAAASASARKSSTSTATATTTSAAISPALMEWMSSKQQQQTPDQANQEDDEEDVSSSASSFTPFNDKEDASKRRRGGAQPTVCRSPMASLLNDVLADGDGNENNNNENPGDDVDAKIAATAKALDELVSQSITTVPLNKVLEQVRLLLNLCSSSNSQVDSKSGGGGAYTGLLGRRQRRRWMISSIGSGSGTSINYRLAWVGSDASVCHIGTGLHKVPLARLQEVFLSFQPRNRIQLLEVIRLLGPFPNVKNTLQGTHESILIENPIRETISGDNKASISQVELPWQQWEIDWTSMIDGMGKEVLAGNSDRVRKVSLQVAFCHPKVLVAVIPPATTAAMTTTTTTTSSLAMGKNQRSGGSKKLSSTQPIRNDPLEDSGAHVLVFVRDEEMDDKLETLRVV